MQHHSRWIVAVMVVVMPLAGCDDASEAKINSVRPATVEKQESGPSRIKLTELAAKRLDIQFEEMKGTNGRLEASYNVVFYGNFGREWVIVSSQPNVFTRTAVKIERVEGDKVYFSKGPAVGTKLVTYGIAELIGIEYGIGQ